MTPPPGDGGSPAPIDRPILAFLRSRFHGAQHVERALLSDADGHLELRVVFAAAYYPEHVDEATLHVRWYTNDDFSIHYRAEHTDRVWTCRWDRHPNPHDTRDHFHPPPDAGTPGEESTWPTDYRDVVRLVLDDVEMRIEQLWDG